ncbi:glycosyltransferase [Cytophaga aurantiaca]|uniref:glycosyltransferase n=1 Tax=Cytophaga aurantiaca TaxID=29530 RepID=UPI0003783875|nr:glycosyltransferase [Cytophaga aurantiaca]
MSFVPYLFLGYATVYIFYQIILLYRIFFCYKPVAFASQKPQVSILIAARNEEAHILNCLQAIECLNYPAENITVWIGDDQSTDATHALVKTFIQDKPNHHLIAIEPSVTHVKGKANVLAQLARKAQGEFLFITDADIQVPKYWIESILGGFKEKTGIVSGSTIVTGKSWFARIQRIDWAYASGMIHVVSEMNIPVTAIGNNMAIRRTCYDDTGGYENLSFSVTEDLELFLAALKKGWGYRNLLDAGSTAFSAPMEKLGETLQQRKRWITGAFRLPKSLVIFLALQSIFFPVLVLAFIFLPWIWVLMFWLTIINLHHSFIDVVAYKMQVGRLRRNVLLFELNRYFFPLLLFLYSLLPLGVEWKGRTYKGKEIQP